MLEVKNLSFSYDKKNKVLDDISFSINDGSIVGILGKNGVGKTTLMKAILGLNKGASGDILIDNVNLKGLKDSERSKLIGYVPQKIEFSNSTVFDAILIGRRPYFKLEPSSLDLKIVDEIINDLSLDKIAFKSVNNLSGGEMQKVAIARSLAQKTKILYLDEPTSSLDINNQIEVLDLITKVTKKSNLITLINIHDLNLALKYFDYLIILKDSKIIKDTSKDELTKDDIMDAFNVKAKIIEYDNKKHIII